ncbi:hypothetical protein P3T37_001177 [Kitasatospora sp. MAA4]|uniref:hypothetical protein n=1 Tax=Kitasatospora sp. MAA4 TaxID=3035093 RepID=UPI0024762FDD|nr:hypothetical protein [Kitasatospora sp. MAA4]MDH6131803.1 hypothetical protein [Kitasatospora sp. MAA4]
MNSTETPGVGRYAPDRYVPEQQPPDENGRTWWAIRDRRTSELLRGSGEVDGYPWREGAERHIEQQRTFDRLGQ